MVNFHTGEDQHYIKYKDWWKLMHTKESYKKIVVYETLISQINHNFLSSSLIIHQ